MTHARTENFDGPTNIRAYGVGAEVAGLTLKDFNESVFSA